MKLVGYSFTYKLSCPLKQLCHSFWPTPVSVIFGLLAIHSTFFLWWTGAEIGNRNNRALVKNVVLEALSGAPAVIRGKVHWSATALSKDTSAQGQFGSKVNDQLWLSVSQLKYTIAFFLHRSWFITLTEREAFADQSLCCYSLTINNEERCVWHPMSLAKSRQGIKVNSGYK